MKAKELIDNLKANFASIPSSNINALTDTHLMYMLDEARATYAAQKMDAAINVTLMSQFVDVEPKESELFSDELGTEISIVKLDIPKPIDYSNGVGIFTVGPTDGSTSYSKIEYSQLRTALARKYTGRSPKWFWFNDTVYVLNIDPTFTDKVRVRGIFDEPWRITLAKGEFKRLRPWDFEYPLSFKEAGIIYTMAMQSDLAWGDSALQATNNAKAKSQKDNQLLDALKNLGNKTAE
jgi:hypothetical protein